MSDSNYIPDGTGVVMGDRKPMPDRGTSTGMTGYNTELDGASLDGEATNSLGSITSATKSDAPDESPSDDPTFGPNAADRMEDAQEDRA